MYLDIIEVQCTCKWICNVWTSNYKCCINCNYRVWW